MINVARYCGSLSGSFSQNVLSSWRDPRNIVSSPWKIYKRCTLSSSAASTMGSSNSRVQTETRLDGKTAIITGCNTGIGKVTALRFCKIGARVIMACRDVQRAEEAAAEIRTECASLENAGQVRVQRLDLGSLASVRQCAQDILDSEQQIHLLVNNAGVMMTPYQKTEDGFEMQFGINHLGHFLFTCLLLPRIIASAPARIVNLSSEAHQLGSINFDDLMSEKSYGAYSAYCQSKLANVLFTKELARRLGDCGVTVYAVHPGIVRTELGRYLDKAYFTGLLTIVRFVCSPFSKSPEQGALTTIHCSIDEKAGQETGLYYSDSKVKAPQRRALDEEAAKRLWDESVRYVKLEMDPFKDLPKSVSGKTTTQETPEAGTAKAV